VVYFALFTSTPKINNTAMMTAKDRRLHARAAHARRTSMIPDGRSPNGRGGRNPLHGAAAKGHVEVCRMLMEAGAVLDARMETIKQQATTSHSHLFVSQRSQLCATQLRRYVLHTYSTLIQIEFQVYLGEV
jgi:hypothetical protein